VPDLTTLNDAAEPAFAEAPFICSVSAITWERVHLTIRFQLVHADGRGFSAADMADLRLEMVADDQAHPVEFIPEGTGEAVAQINITRFNGRHEVPDGTYRFAVVTPAAERVIAGYDGREVAKLDEASRVFPFSGNKAVVAVAFDVAEAVDGLDFLMRMYQYQREGKSPAQSSLRGRIKSRYLRDEKKARYVGFLYRWISRIVGVRRGRMFFASDQRGEIAGNLLRVRDRLVERGLDSRFDFRYSFRLPGSKSLGNTFRIVWLLATSEFVLLDDYFGLLKGVQLNSTKTRLIQLWHAGSGFKAVGYSRFGHDGSPKLRHPHRQYTYAITGSTHLVPVYAEAFGIEESAVIPTGLPRVDWFLDPELTARFREDFAAEYPQLVGKRVILFAPTFRGRSIHNAYYDYSWIDFDALYEACGPDDVVLFRMHHFVPEAVPIPEAYRDKFIDFTHYPDGLNLLHVVDLLITDYSSIIYEYSLLDRPMLFFAPDRVTYAVTRGFHRDYAETAPGRVCDTFEELVGAIKAEDFEHEKVKKFRAENFDRVDTNAADRVIDWLILGQLPAAGVEETPAGELRESGTSE